MKTRIIPGDIVRWKRAFFGGSFEGVVVSYNNQFVVILARGQFRKLWLSDFHELFERIMT